MSEKLISIIVPIYNAEQFIEQTIRSVISQSYPHFELIVINDGSTDQSESIVSSWLSKDKRISLISKKNEGPSAARNMGLEKANGDYILFVDADDVLKKGMLAKLIQREVESDMIIFGYENHYSLNSLDNNVILPEIEGTYSLDMFISNFGMLYQGNLIHYLWNKLYKRDCIEGIRFDESIKVGEDLLFNLDVFKRIETVTVDREAYYIHNWYNINSITKKFHRELLWYRKRQFEEISGFLKDFKANSEENNLLIQQSFFKKILGFLMSIEAKDAQLSYKDKRILLIKTTQVMKELSFLDYKYKAIWENAVVFLMKHKLYFLLYLSNKFLKVIQDKRRRH